MKLMLQKFLQKFFCNWKTGFKRKIIDFYVCNASDTDLQSLIKPNILRVFMLVTFKVFCIRQIPEKLKAFIK
jgi:hypothetical protein